MDHHPRSFNTSFKSQEEKDLIVSWLGHEAMDWVTLTEKIIASISSQCKPSNGEMEDSEKHEQNVTAGTQ